MKKILILSIALLAAVPGLQADHNNTCSSSKKHVAKKACATCANAKVCRACTSHGKEACSCKHSAHCKCSNKSKGGPVKRTLRATGNVVKDTGEVVAAPFKALFGDDEDAKESHHVKHNNHKASNEIHIDQLEENDMAESSNDSFSAY